MAKMTREELDAIIRRDMKGYHLAPKTKKVAGIDKVFVSSNVDAGTPDLEALRRKYSGTPRQSRRAGGASDSSRPKDDDAIVIVEPDDDSDSRDRPSRRKSVVVSRKGVVGKQG